MTTGEHDAERFFAGHELALAVFRSVYGLVRQDGPVEVRVSRSQVALWRRHGFAYLWLPGQYLAHPGADVVLSFALGREVSSPRFKEVAHPARAQWMHHLEIHDVAEVDDEVADWLREASGRAA